MAKTIRLGVHAAAVGATLMAVGLLALMVVAAQQPAEATFPGKNGKIAYVSSDGHDREIYTIDPDGTNRAQLTHNNTKDEAPSYSPDGKKVALSARQGKEWEIYTINATGGNRFKVTNKKTQDREPSYSPNGKRIAYSARHGEDFDIFTITVGGGSRLNLTNARALPKDRHPYDWEPSYSPNGKKIAFMGNCGSHCAAIYTINIGGGRSTKVSRGGFLNSPDYSPSGKKIAYINYSQIETINATGGGRSVVFKGIKGSLLSLSVSYSPDGKNIAYSGRDVKGKDLEIYTIPVGGGKPVQVTHNNTDDLEPSWGSR